MRDPKERRRDILEAIARIDRYAAHGRDAFEREELIQVWVVHHLQIIGEAAAQLGRDFHAAHPEVPRASALRELKPKSGSKQQSD